MELLSTVQVLIPREGLPWNFEGRPMPVKVKSELISTKFSFPVKHA